MPTTREEWLKNAVNAFRPRFKEIEYPLPDKIHVSVGFSYGARAERKVMGTTWSRFASEDGANHVFISPELGDTFDVIETMIHELVHVAVDNQDGHQGVFVEVARALGLTKPWSYTPAGPVLAAELLTIAHVLGEYPHGVLHPQPSKIPSLVGAPGPDPGVKLTSGPPKQHTYLRKRRCPTCGYTVRVTARWLKHGSPICPVDMRPMEED
jgi:hypothetical protein